MPLVKTKLPRRLCQAGIALLALGIILVPAILVRDGLRAKPLTVPQAEARLQTATRHFELAKRMTNSAERIATRIGLTNSVPTMQSLLGNWLPQLRMNAIHAQIDVQVAGVFAVADYCVERYEDYNHAQEATVVLEYWNITNRLREVTNTLQSEGAPPRYELLVPHDRAQRARELLRDPQMVRATNASGVQRAMAAVAALRLNRIGCVMRGMRTLGQGDTAILLFVVFVHSSDKEAAAELLGDSPQNTPGSLD